MCFLQNPEIIFFLIFHIYNLDFFFMLQYYKSVYVVDTFRVQLLLQFYTIPTETIQMFLIIVWRYAYAFYIILKILFFLLFSHF